MSSVQEYFDAIPALTKRMLGIQLFFTAGQALGLVNPAKLVFIPQLVWERFEIWRLFTNFFYKGAFSISWLFSLMILARFASALENDPFPTSTLGNGSDFLFCLLFLFSTLLVAGYFTEKMLLGSALLFAIVYLWSKRNPNSPVNVYGFRFTGTNLPWVYLAFTVLTGGDVISDVMGLAAGHLFYFLVEFLPVKYGTNYLTTPNMVSKMYAGLVGGEAQRPIAPTVSSGRPGGATTTAPTQTSAAHSWGTGNRLGSN